MIRNQTDTIVIRPKTSPTFILAMIGIGVVVFVASVGAAYFLGHWQGRAPLAQMQKDLDEQERRFNALSEHYEKVQDTFVQMKRQLHIDDSAYTALRQELEQSNRQLAEMSGELTFYRSIIFPQEGQKGVRVQELAITPTEDERRFRYKLVLVQTLKEGKQLNATLKLTIKGKSGDEPTTVQHPGPGEESMRVRFRYFQNLTGTLELPSEFTPLEVKIDLSGEKKKALLAERWYSWRQLMADKTS